MTILNRGVLALFFTIAAGLYYCNLSSIFFFAYGTIRIFLDFVAPGVRNSIVILALFFFFAPAAQNFFNSNFPF